MEGVYRGGYPVAVRLYRIALEDPLRLAIMSRPRDGEWLGIDLRMAKEAGVKLVVSCLEPGEAEQLGLEDEGRTAEALGLRFLSVPIPDHSTPADDRALDAAARALAAELRRGESVAVHCFAGLGRSPTVAAAALVATGMKLEAALERIGEARGAEVPETPDQKDWLEKFEARFKSRER